MKQRPDVLVTLPMRFREAGYRVASAGKIFHHTDGFNPPDQWDAYFDQPGRGTDGAVRRARLQDSVGLARQRQIRQHSVRQVGLGACGALSAVVVGGGTVERRQVKCAHRPRQRRA